jgi:Protein of unknown function (DUF732)
MIGEPFGVRDAAAPAEVLDGHRRRRAAAEAAADRAESQASEAARRAAAAIAAAAQAAQEAEDAAAVAAQAAERAEVERAAEVACTSRMPIVAPAAPVPPGPPLGGPGDGIVDRPAVAALAVDPFAGPRPARSAGVSGPAPVPAQASGPFPAGRIAPLHTAPVASRHVLETVVESQPRHGRREPAGEPATVLSLCGADAVTELIPVTADGDGSSRHGRRSSGAELRAAAISRAAAQDPDTAVIGRTAEDDVTADAGAPAAPLRPRDGRPAADPRGDEAPDADGPPAGPGRDRDPGVAADRYDLDGDRADRGTDDLDGEPDRPGAVSRFRAALRSRRGRTIAVAGAAVLVVAAGAGAAGAALHGSPGAAAPSPVAAAAPVAPAADAAATVPVDPKSPKAVAFLKALRRAGVPVSTSGLTETQAAALICDRIGSGTSDRSLARSLPAVLPTVTDDDAPAVVGAARKAYC